MSAEHLDLDRLETIAKAATQWGNRRWFVFDNPRSSGPVEIRRGTPEGGPDASMRTWQELPCDECGGDHVNGADRWYVAEMTKATTRNYGCGRKGIRSADQSIRDEAAHIATFSPSTALALIAEIRRLRIALGETAAPPAAVPALPVTPST